MKTFAMLSLLSLATAAAAPAIPKAAVTDAVHGDYLEARTASVFAGPCHYNAELVTTGRDAVLAWDVTGGVFHGVDLTGVKAMAAVSADENLADAGAAKKAELVIDLAATPRQADAWTSLVKAKYGAALGRIVSVRRSDIRFATGSSALAPHFGSIAIEPMPNGECCKQPNLVWYTPMVPLQWRKVGYTTEASYAAGTLSDSWYRGDENSAFYGQFEIGK